MKKITIKSKIGSLPGDTSWWTKEDWDRYHADVEKAKADKTYGQEIERTFIMGTEPFADTDNNTSLGECFILMPKGKLK